MYVQSIASGPESASLPTPFHHLHGPSDTSLVATDEKDLLESQLIFLSHQVDPVRRVTSLLTHVQMEADEWDSCDLHRGIQRTVSLTIKRSIASRCNHCFQHLCALLYCESTKISRFSVPSAQSRYPRTVLIIAKFDGAVAFAGT